MLRICCVELFLKKSFFPAAVVNEVEQELTDFNCGWRANSCV